MLRPHCTGSWDMSMYVGALLCTGSWDVSTRVEARLCTGSWDVSPRVEAPLCTAPGRGPKQTPAALVELADAETEHFAMGRRELREEGTGEAEPSSLQT